MESDYYDAKIWGDRHERFNREPFRSVKPGNTVLRPDDLAEIRERLAAGETAIEIAGELSVDPGIISSIANGKTWAWVGVEL